MKSESRFNVQVYGDEEMLLGKNPGRHGDQNDTYYMRAFAGGLHFVSSSV
jgi:hypothetical protein